MENISKKFVLFLVFFYTSLSNSLPSFIEYNYASINLSSDKYYFYTWYNSELINKGLLQKMDAKYFGNDFDFSSFFDCNDNYNTCVNAYIVYFLLPYNYFDNIMYVDYNFKNNMILFSYSKPIMDNNTGNTDYKLIKVKLVNFFNPGEYVYTIFNELNYTFYYKNAFRIYFDEIPLTNMKFKNWTNSYFYYNDEPYFYFKDNLKDKKLFRNAYNDFKSYKSNFKYFSDTLLNRTYNLKDKALFYDINSNKVLTNSSYVLYWNDSKGFYNFYHYLKFNYSKFCNEGDRLYSLYYSPGIDYKLIHSGDKRTTFSKDNLRYSLIKGPDAKIYLESITISNNN